MIVLLKLGFVDGHRLEMTNLIGQEPKDPLGQLELDPPMTTPMEIVSCLRLTHYHIMPHFEAYKTCSCGKYCEKRESACNKQFLTFSQYFLPNMACHFHFKCTLKCHLHFVSIWTSLKFVIW